eukprot:14976691-Ditylum_brightwellii.AAC.1
MLMMKGIHHPEGNAHRLYLHRSKGGRGLTNVEDTHSCECVALGKYVLNSTDPLAQMVHITVTPMQKFLLKFALSPKIMSPELMDDNHLRCLKEKPLHGKFFHQQEETPQVDLTQLHQWLCCAQLCPETEAAI